MRPWRNSHEEKVNVNCPRGTPRDIPSHKRVLYAGKHIPRRPPLSSLFARTEQDRMRNEINEEDPKFLRHFIKLDERIFNAIHRFDSSQSSIQIKSVLAWSLLRRLSCRTKHRLDLYHEVL